MSTARAFTTLPPTLTLLAFSPASNFPFTCADDHTGTATTNQTAPRRVLPAHDRCLRPFCSCNPGSEYGSIGDAGNIDTGAISQQPGLSRGPTQFPCFVLNRLFNPIRVRTIIAPQLPSPRRAIMITPKEHVWPRDHAIREAVRHATLT
jgi:hypothetical protein